MQFFGCCPSLISHLQDYTIFIKKNFDGKYLRSRKAERVAIGDIR
jgi:hypothetical protein